MEAVVFVLCSLAFHTGELVAFRAANKLALVAACVDGDETAALRNMAEDGVVGLKHLYGLIYALNHVFIETRSYMAYVDSVRGATTWGPQVPILEAATDILGQAILAPHVSTSEFHYDIQWIVFTLTLALDYMQSASITARGVDVLGGVVEPSCHGLAVNRVDLKAFTTFPLHVSGYQGATYQELLLRRFITLVIITLAESPGRFGDRRRWRVLRVVRHVC